MQKNSDNFSIQDAMHLARSDAGQQLLALLQSQNSDALRKAMQDASSGNYDQVKQTIAPLLASQEVKALLEQLGRQNNG